MQYGLQNAKLSNRDEQLESFKEQQNQLRLKREQVQNTSAVSTADDDGEVTSVGHADGVNNTVSDKLTK